MVIGIPLEPVGGLSRQAQMDSVTAGLNQDGTGAGTDAGGVVGDGTVEAAAGVVVLAGDSDGDGAGDGRGQ